MYIIITIIFIINITILLYTSLLTFVFDKHDFGLLTKLCVFCNRNKKFMNHTLTDN